MQKQTTPPEPITLPEGRWATKLAEEAALWRSKKRPGQRIRRIAANGREIFAERILRVRTLKTERI
jgi:hypothetical protein